MDETIKKNENFTIQIVSISITSQIVENQNVINYYKQRINNNFDKGWTTYQDVHGMHGAAKCSNHVYFQDNLFSMYYI